MACFYLGIPQPLAIQQPNSEVLFKGAKAPFSFQPLKSRLKNKTVRNANQGNQVVALTGTTIKNKCLDLNFSSCCPFEQPLKYFIGPDTGLIPSIVTESQKYTRGLCRRVATVKTRLGSERRM